MLVKCQTWPLALNQLSICVSSLQSGAKFITNKGGIYYKLEQSFLQSQRAFVFTDLGKSH